MLLGVLVALSLSGCEQLDYGYTQIGDLLKNPSRYNGMEVKVRGTVTGVVKLPFFSVKMYTIKDDTGEVPVLTYDTLPGLDAEVRVRGALQTMAIVGKDTIGLHVREIKRW
jgi:hypothetical protein